ncbi:DUF2474 domain-containing protein [Jiella sonneratiae]|uniref:DUF2474 domain-containing protein n=1 Tax=Jiella sonneratiae TaxID=2816856 RepID=A0ABS3JAG9_9HYPH|nr:DUF2474 domain-containing protein [Jiella sonneratiae]MBO0905933.1 DUF2474 domain-containing protein [Jiella sonneratiae]
MTPEDVRRASAGRPRWQRWLWFLLLWCAGVGFVGAVALTLRLMLVG